MAKEIPPESGLTSRDIRELIRILSRTDVEELELERAGERVRLRRFSRSGGAPPPPAQVSIPQPGPASPAPAAAPLPDSGGETTLKHGQETITSPIVGTYYRAGAPEGPPFVQEGDTVKAGQTLCIIEAMKLMNEVEAEKACRIVRCLMEDATPVEYGEPLFVVEPL